MSTRKSTFNEVLQFSSSERVFIWPRFDINSSNQNSPGKISVSTRIYLYQILILIFRNIIIIFRQNYPNQWKLKKIQEKFGLAFLLVHWSIFMIKQFMFVLMKKSNRCWQIKKSRTQKNYKNLECICHVWIGHCPRRYYTDLVKLE